MLHPFPPFIVALYFGSIKPNEADAFIPDFMEEYKMLNLVGFEQVIKLLLSLLMRQSVMHLFISF